MPTKISSIPVASPSNALGLTGASSTDVRAKTTLEVTSTPTSTQAKGVGKTPSTASQPSESTNTNSAGNRTSTSSILTRSGTKASTPKSLPTITTSDSGKQNGSSKSASSSSSSKPPTTKPKTSITGTIRQRLRSLTRREPPSNDSPDGDAGQSTTQTQEVTSPTSNSRSQSHTPSPLSKSHIPLPETSSNTSNPSLLGSSAPRIPHTSSEPAIEIRRDSSPGDIEAPPIARTESENDLNLSSAPRGRSRVSKNGVVGGGSGLSPQSSPIPELKRLRSGRSSTSPIPDRVQHAQTRISKRLIVCCDGTWQDGISQNRRWRYSNILKLSRCIDHEDERTTPPTPQIVFYQSGLGTQDHVIGQLVDGAFGAHLAEKVQEAYAWISQNYHPGDEIFLFGFSRGAYTARMVSTIIGQIGLLSRSEMDNFADIFVAYQKRGKTSDPKEQKEYQDLIDKFSVNGRGRIRHYGKSGFSVKVVGVFDTVGSLGLPQEFTRTSKMKTLFDFPDKQLPEHVERAYQAMALNEERADFNITKFHQSPKGKELGQILRQMWFTGSHTDVGGGFQDHDLSDLALVWMIAEIEDVLSIDLKYLKALPHPVKPWGVQGPHYSKNGIFAIGATTKRVVEPNNTETCERIHLSVESQIALDPTVVEVLQKFPDVLEKRLLPLEEEIRSGWKYVEGSTPPRQDTGQAREEEKREAKALESIRNATKKAAKKGMTVMETAAQIGGEVVAGSGISTGVRRNKTHYEESSVAKVWEEIVD